MPGLQEACKPGFFLYIRFNAASGCIFLTKMARYNLI